MLHRFVSSAGMVCMATMLALLVLLLAAVPSPAVARVLLSGRPASDRTPLRVLLPGKNGNQVSQPLDDSPVPISPSDNQFGGETIDTDRQGGPAGTDLPWSELVSETVDQFIAEGEWNIVQFQPTDIPLYKNREIRLELDLTKLFSHEVQQQGTCNSCWATSAAGHMQAVLISKGFLSGPYVDPLNPPAPVVPDPPVPDPPVPGGGGLKALKNEIRAATTIPTPGLPNPLDPSKPAYNKLSIQQLIDCASSTGCEGGSVLDAFRWISSNGIVGRQFYIYKQDAQEPTMSEQCTAVPKVLDASGLHLVDPPRYGVGPDIAFHVVPPCLDAECPPDLDKENALLQYMQSNQLPVVAYVDASNWSNFTCDGSIFLASDCNSSGQAAEASSHVIQIVGYGTDNTKGKRTPFWLIRNSWGQWCEAGHIRLEFGQNACGLMNYVVQVDASGAGEMPPPSPSAVANE